MTAFVTGAGAGIGAAIARALSAQGYAVAVGDIDEDAAHAVAADLHTAIAVPLDVTDRRSIGSACDAALAALGPLKAWISNAGISSMAKFTDVREEELDRRSAAIQS
jgi:meso-butanediol dehydrogenase/(S,S)-butanediol dehydrogenase/diacetyl reductase